MRNAIAALAFAAVAGGGAYLLFRRRTTMTAEELAQYLTERSPESARPWARDIAEAAIRTLPSDYFPAQDSDVALRRWALLIVAIGDHESAFGFAPGYFPEGDPTGYGDRGNAFGFFQIDRRYHWGFIQSTASQTVFGQALYATRRILAPNWLRFSFVADLDEREHLAVIGYNASAARIEMLIRQGASVEEADLTSTKTADGTPYGADVLARLERMS